MRALAHSIKLPATWCQQNNNNNHNHNNRCTQSAFRLYALLHELVGLLYGPTEFTHPYILYRFELRFIHIFYSSTHKWHFI